MIYSMTLWCTFFAEITFTKNENEDLVLSCRPSDGVALAIRNSNSVAITIEKNLFEENFIELDADNAEDEIEQFKSFLDDISPDDFSWNIQLELIYFILFGFCIERVVV